eukprot:1903175-Amphidinium_carterae.1
MVPCNSLLVVASQFVDVKGQFFQPAKVTCELASHHKAQNDHSNNRYSTSKSRRNTPAMDN